MKNLFLIIPLFFLFASCGSLEKTRSKAYGYFAQYPNELAELCGRTYTDKEPIYIEGKTITKTDTLTDTLKVPVYVDCPDGTKKKADCPPNKKIIIDNSRIDTVKADKPETIAKIKDLQNKNNELEAGKKAAEDKAAEAIKESKRAKTWLYSIAGVLLVIGGFVVYGIYKKLITKII